MHNLGDESVNDLVLSKCRLPNITNCIYGGRVEILRILIDSSTVTKGRALGVG